MQVKRAIIAPVIVALGAYGAILASSAVPVTAASSGVGVAASSSVSPAIVYQA